MVGSDHVVLSVIFWYTKIGISVGHELVILFQG